MNKFLDKKYIIGLFILFVLIYFYYSYKPYVHNVLQKEYVFMADDYIGLVSTDLIPESTNGRKYTYAFWINIMNVPENAIWNEDFRYQKPIIFHFGSPNIYYIPKTHELKISIVYKDELNEKNSYDFILDKIETQKWTHIGVVVNNTEVDIYHNGELHASTILKNVPWIPTKFLYLGQKNNNFNGYLYYLEYANINFNRQQMRQIYNARKNSVPNNLITYSQYFNEKQKNNK